MSEAAPRARHFSVADTIGFAERVLAYTAGFDQASFVANTPRYDATVRNPELLGEAATHLPRAVRQANPQVPRRMTIARRNRLMHGYLGIDDDPLSARLIRRSPRRASRTASPIDAPRAVGRRPDRPLDAARRSCAFVVARCARRCSATGSVCAAGATRGAGRT